MPSASDQVSKAGIVTSESGERHIPSSERADGSKRREIKIRPGYRPPEDVETYKNRTAEAFRSRGSGGVPGAAGVDEGKAGEVEGKASNKNAKRREARKKAKAAAADSLEGVEGIDEAVQEDESQGKNVTQPPTESSPKLDGAEEVETEKQARKLHKKLRQAKDLRDKQESGSSLQPEQVEKVNTIENLVRQLDDLGFDPEGRRKEP